MPESSPNYTRDDGDTLLVNLEHVDIDDVDYYVGPDTEMYDVSASQLQNPYPVTDVGRLRSQIYYQLYIFEHYLTDVEFREKIATLKGKVIAGWNYPQHCHGEVLIDICTLHCEEGFSRVLQYISSEVEDIPTSKLGVHGFSLLDDVETELEHYKSKEA